MQIIMNSYIAKLLNQSPIPAVIINGETNNIWYNDAYLNMFKNFPNLIDALQHLLSMNENEIYNFIEHKHSEKIKTFYNNTKYYISKEYKKSINFTIISIIPEEMYNYDLDNIMLIEEYFFMNVPTPCIVFDFHTKKVEVANNAFLKICGIPVEHIKDMYIAGLFYKSEYLINNYLNSSIPYSKTFLINQYDIETNKIMIFEVIPIIKETLINETTTYKVIFMMRDIYGEIKAQRDLISKDFLRYQFLTRSISDGMLVVSNGIITDVNNATCALWRYEKRELLNKPLSLIIPDATQYIDNASTVAGNSILFLGVRKDNTQFNGSLKVQAFNDLDTCSMVYIVRDLTNYNAIERLMENQSDFTSQIFYTQPNMIAVFNEHHILTKCNKSFLDFFGYLSIEEAIYNIGELSTRFLDSDDSTFITSIHKNNWLVLPVEHQNIEYKVGMVDKSGNYTVFNLKTTLMKNETDIFYVVSFTNITETLKIQQSLKETNSKIQSHNKNLQSTLESNMNTLVQYQKLATIGTMIGFITHQWKQPLNAIGLIAQNTADIMEEDEQFDRDDTIDMMQSIMDNVVFMSETMENFKNFFKAEDVSVPFKVSHAIKSIVSFLDPVLKKSNVEIVYNIPNQHDNINTFGFVNDLKQVIMNIIVNGRDAIITRKEKEPEIKGQITIKTDNDNNENIVVTISDNGTGLSEETLQKIFEMYYTTKGAKGTGIGMYMAQMIIEKMHGNLHVKNRDNGEQGAEMIITLPIYEES